MNEKLLACDRCPAMVRFREAKAVYEAGWRLHFDGRRRRHVELCPTCAGKVLRRLSRARQKAREASP